MHTVGKEKTMKFHNTTLETIVSKYHLQVIFERPGTKISALLVALSVGMGLKTLVYASESSKHAQVRNEQLVNPSAFTQKRISFQRSIYVSTGFGASRLEPENSGTSSWKVSERINAGGQITLGTDINRHFSIELHSADLGSAGVEQIGGLLNGRINYHMHGGSVLWYLGKNRHEHKRRGFTSFARVGVAMMHNSAVGNAPYSQRNSTQMLLGAGFEYSTKIGLGLRAEIISFDQDAQYAQLALLYRFGKKPSARKSSVLELKPALPVPVALVIPSFSVDTDNDGVTDSEDHCENTRPSASVNPYGCAGLKGVNFYSDSDRLTTKAQKILDGVATTLQQYPRANVNVHAHTDSQGSAYYNQKLSNRRAESVVKYLNNKGVDSQKLVPFGFGESNPIASNKTEQGRAFNRRVELWVTR